MTNYDRFAPFYDAVLGGRTERVSSYLKTLIKKHAPQATSLLEIACGTGNIMGEFHDDYSIAGLDLSAPMVEQAQKKFPDADLHVADMTHFSFGKTFDVIICVFDSMNHLEALEDWKKTMQCAKSHLNDGGIFLFDMNTKAQFDLYRDNDPLGRVCGDDYAILQCLSGEDENEVFWTFDIFGQEEDGRYSLHQERIRERTYPFTNVESVAKDVFSSVSIFAEDDERSPEETERLYFICQ